MQEDKQKLNESGLIYNAIFHQAPIGISIAYDYEPYSSYGGELVSVNAMFEQIVGRTKEDIINLGWAQVTHPDDLDEDMKNYRKLQSGEISGYSMEKRYIKPDGSIVWVHMVVSPLELSNDKCNVICLIQDITRRKETEKALSESERSKTVFLSHLPGMAYRCNYDPQWTMQYVSAGCFELTGYPPESLLYNRDLSFNDLIPEEYRGLLWKEWEHAIENRQPFKYEYELITANGERKWVMEMGQGIYNEKGEAEFLEGTILDISTRKEVENSLRYISEHDVLTGLYNRRYLENLLKQDADKDIAEKRAVVGVNLSAAHMLSLIYGFQYSQELIKKSAEALGSMCNDNCRLFNTYENRFVFYIKDYKDKGELTAFCEDVVSILERVFASDRIVGGVGIVEIDEDNKCDVEQLLKELLIASEKAFDSYDRNFGICFFDAEIEAQIIREETIRRELAQISEDEADDRLFMLFQPVLDLKSNRICGFEALARLNSAALGLVSPLEFIPIAEKTKLIIPLGKKIIRLALRFINTLKDNGYDTLSVSINISGIQLLKNDFLHSLLKMIDEAGINPANIGIEITESVFALDYQDANRILGKLKESGVKIAIDDFGTEYSSLSRERELNVNCLKIDKYFIDKLLTLTDEEAITGDIISMAHKLGHCVVAEGVEHERQLRYLRKYGCDRVQGYLIAKPLGKEAALELLKSQENKSGD